ncbi:MAG: insulinase family protein [Acidobacteria bacterium]|nr:insulinase family protein [Acidobacteriota bacterium]
MSNIETDVESFRREPPAPLAPRPLNLPAVEELTLANGLRRIGATLNAGANSDYTTVAASSLSNFADEILELMADVCLRPSFPEDELELTKQNTLQNLIAQRGQASFLASERVSQVIYGAHPYHVVAPTPESVEATTRDEVAAFHRAVFIPNNAVLVCGGDFDRGRLLRRVEELFGAWQRAEPLGGDFPAPPARESRAAYLVDRPGSAQSNIIIANSAIRSNPTPRRSSSTITTAGAKNEEEKW